MVARDVEHAAAELRVLRHEVWEQLGLAGIAFGLALVATQLRPAFALPLLFGGLTALILFARALVKRWELLDRLALDREAYAIAEVRRRAERVATIENRHMLASSIHCLLSHPGPAAERVGVAAKELEVLAAELDDDELALDPAAAVACERLVNNVTESPLRNPALPPEDVRSRVSQILTGFVRRRA